VECGHPDPADEPRCHRGLRPGLMEVLQRADPLRGGDPLPVLPGLPRVHGDHAHRDPLLQELPAPGRRSEAEARVEGRTAEFNLYSTRWRMRQVWRTIWRTVSLNPQKSGKYFFMYC